MSETPSDARREPNFMSMLRPSEPASGKDRAAASPAFALWNLGFRPFYLLAGTFAAIAVPIWVANFSGWAATSDYLRNPLWHAHEMIFGYAFAVIVGFLFTAVRNWTNRPTPTGMTLAAIAALWIAGRIAVALPFPMLAAGIDTAFALAATAGIAVPIIAGANRRNIFFIFLLLAIGAANLAFHLGMAGVIDVPVQRGLQFGLNVVIFIMVVMGGRVIPMFTANAIPGAQPVRKVWLERFALGSVLAVMAADLADLPPAGMALVAGIAGAANAWRFLLWQPWRTFGKPLVWILHLSYAWIVAYFLLRVPAAWGWVSPGLASHAATVGAIGGLTLGMMTRTSRGHTGRPLESGAAETACYVLIQLAAVFRVFAPLAVPDYTRHAVICSGLLWTAAFVLFVGAYWPILTRPRIDGRSG